MIRDGRFATQLNTIGDIFDCVSLFEERQYAPNKSLGASHFRRMSYRQVYDECIRQFAYDFRLIDQSLLLFSKHGRNCHDGGLSYSYYECPVSAIGYEQFVLTEFDIAPDDEAREQFLVEVGDELRREYDDYLISLDAKNVVTPLRYDYSADQYTAGIHPASHMHFGFENEIRVGTRKVMNPISFALFIMRHRYPKHWDLLMKDRDCARWCRNIREYPPDVDVAYWRSEDERELSLR